MRDQFSVGCRCGQSDSEDVDPVSTTEYVRTREYTFCRCRGCGEVWRERHLAQHAVSEWCRRSTDDRLRPALVA
jgi:uncharacterized Zn finger protein